MSPSLCSGSFQTQGPTEHWTILSILGFTLAY